MKLNSMNDYNEKVKNYSKYIVMAIGFAIVFAIFINIMYRLGGFLLALIIRYWWGAIFVGLVLLFIIKRRRKKKRLRR